MSDHGREAAIAVGALTFDATTRGKPGDPLVLLLHGFPQTRYTWRHQLAPLADAGYLAAAPDQRGYSPGARPRGIEHYATELLVGDAIGMMQSLGYERAHVVGHDWGGQLAWLLAAHHPERVETLTVLSRPHPQAFAESFHRDVAQAERSKHHRAFQDPDTARLLLEDDARRLRRSFSNQGVPAADQDAYLAVLGNVEALDAAINWYRAGGSRSGDRSHSRVGRSHSRGGRSHGRGGRSHGRVTVPTLYIWGDADATVGRVAAAATADFVDGPYRFEVLPGVGHFITDQAGAKVTELLLDHLSGAATRGSRHG